MRLWVVLHDRTCLMVEPGPLACHPHWRCGSHRHALVQYHVFVSSVCFSSFHLALVTLDVPRVVCRVFLCLLRAPLSQSSGKTPPYFCHGTSCVIPNGNDDDPTDDDYTPADDKIVKRLK